MAFPGYEEFARSNTTPSMRTHDEVESAADRAVRTIRAGGKVDTKDTMGVYGKSALFALPYFNLVSMTSIDMMHIIQGVCGRSLFAMVSGDKLGKQLQKEKRRVAAAALRADALAEASLEKQTAAYKVARIHWLAEQNRAVKAKKGTAARALLGKPPPSPPVYIPAAAARVSYTLLHIVTPCNAVLHYVTPCH